MTTAEANAYIDVHEKWRVLEMKALQVYKRLDFLQLQLLDELRLSDDIDTNLNHILNDKINYNDNDDNDNHDDDNDNDNRLSYRQVTNIIEQLKNRY